MFGEERKSLETNRFEERQRTRDRDLSCKLLVMAFLCLQMLRGLVSLGSGAAYCAIDVHSNQGGRLTISDGESDQGVMRTLKDIKTS